MTGDDLTARQDQAIAAILSSPSLKKAAKVVGVAESTLHEWLKAPAFQARLRTARAEVIDAVVTALVRHAQRAVEALVRNLDPKKPPEVQIRAAKAVLDQAAKLGAMADLAAQITDLQEQLARSPVGSRRPAPEFEHAPPGAEGHGHR